MQKTIIFHSKLKISEMKIKIYYIIKNLIIQNGKEEFYMSDSY